MAEISQIIEEQIEAGFVHAHGNESFRQIAAQLKAKKTDKIIQYLRNEFLQDHIDWELVKDHVWQDDTEREKNKYVFLQGDIIETKMILSLGQSKGHQDHDLWIVCTPTCDIINGPEYIRVAKVFRVDITDKSKPEGSSEKDEFKKLVYAAKFSSTKYFPLPPFSRDTSGTFGYYADLITPYYLHRDEIGLAVPIYSLKFKAWHIFNMFLNQLGTRSNAIDEPLIRCYAENLSKPNLAAYQIRIYHGDEDYYVLSKEFSGQQHRAELNDGDEFKGSWVKISDSQEVYWFAKNGVDLKKVLIAP